MLVVHGFRALAKGIKVGRAFATVATLILYPPHLVQNVGKSVQVGWVVIEQVFDVCVHGGA
jgi:hypothetical protein